MKREKSEREVGDMNLGHESFMAQRIKAAFSHPDCPVVMIDSEAAQLARFISIRLSRNKGARVYVAGPGTRS